MYTVKEKELDKRELDKREVKQDKNNKQQQRQRKPSIFLHQVGWLVLTIVLTWLGSMVMRKTDEAAYCLSPSK